MKSSFSLIIRRLISDSSTHLSFRVLLAMLATFIPAIIGVHIGFLSQSSLQISTALCLGVMASAIVEVDENTRDRQKFILTVISCFFIAATSVELLLPYPFLFALGLGSSSFAFLMLGSLNMHYKRIGFGAILVAIYTMIGHQDKTQWFEQPLLLTLGGLWYGGFAIIWSYYSPNKTLREQLAQLFFSLSRYQRQKSALFDTQQGNSHHAITKTRQKLAVLNISIALRLATAQSMFKAQYQHNQYQMELKQLNLYYLIAEQIHERISASQYQYSLLEHTFGRSEILEGFHQLFLQLSEDTYQLGLSLNEKKTYQHSKRLKWTVKALSDQLHLLKQQLQQQAQNEPATLALQAIYSNLHGIDDLLISTENHAAHSPAIELLTEQTKKRGFWAQMRVDYQQKSASFKHAVRISLSLVFATFIHFHFHLENGFWILLTVLFVCQPSFSETWKRLLRRSVGTLLGILISLPAVLYVHHPIGQVGLMILSAFLFFNYLRTNYGLAVVFITLFVMIVSNIQNNTGIDVLSVRIIETLIGCFISVIAITLIYPDWQFKRFPYLTHRLLARCNDYFTAVTKQYLQGRHEDRNFREKRLAAFNADAAITSAWQNMLFEPAIKQRFKQEAYGLVNKCDALNCYIAALSSHRQKIQTPQDTQLLAALFTLTSQQISSTFDPSLTTTKAVHPNLDAFEQYQDQISDDAKLTLEQLRLITYTAIDIQVLLKEINGNDEVIK